MGMPATTTHWTAEMRNALPDDGQRYEVIDGELFVTPAPRMVHQAALGALYLILAPYLREWKVGFAILSPADVEFSDDTVVEPDLFVIPPVNWRPGDERPEVSSEPLVWRPAGVSDDATALTIDLESLFAEITDES